MVFADTQVILLGLVGMSRMSINLPGRHEATDANDSTVLFFEARDARRAVRTVDKSDAVDEEALGDTVRKIIRPPRLISLPRISPATIDDVVKYSCVPPALSEFGVGAILRCSANRS